MAEKASRRASVAKVFVAHRAIAVRWQLFRAVASFASSWHPARDSAMVHRRAVSHLLSRRELQGKIKIVGNPLQKDATPKELSDSRAAVHDHGDGVRSFINL